LRAEGTRIGQSLPKRSSLPGLWRQARYCQAGPALSRCSLLAGPGKCRRRFRLCRHIESGFDPKQRTGSYIGLFQLSEYEFNKFGSGQIRDPRDNAVAAAYKVITEGILFEWVTHKKPTLSDLYLIHQQGWEVPPSTSANLIASLGNPCVPPAKAWRKAKNGANARSGGILFRPSNAWKSVDKLTSGAFAGWVAKARPVRGERYREPELLLAA